jgi:hypothetical protein
MGNFFSDIQGKFSAKFDGRYLGHILEHVASIRPEVLHPILKAAPFKQPISLKTISIENAFAESSYQHGSRADFEIELARKDHTRCRILIEIKINDSLNSSRKKPNEVDGDLIGQLAAYLNWVKERDGMSEDRAVVVLTAYPIGDDERELINANSSCIRHMYLSDFMSGQKSSLNESELFNFFKTYLTEEGFVMHELNDADYDALLSYFVLNFLPHESGHGKVAKAEKIATGPATFAKVVQNWQLVSDRLATTKLKSRTRPTVRYMPQQSQSHFDKAIDLEESDLLVSRRHIRSIKNWGRYWFVADYVLNTQTQLRIEWGQVIEIQKGNESEPKTMGCWIYAFIRKGTHQIAAKKKVFKDFKTIQSQTLNHPEKFMDELFQLIEAVKQSAIESDPTLKQCFSW